MQHNTSECAAGTFVLSASKYTLRATNRSSVSRCNHALAAVSVVARNPDSNVSPPSATDDNAVADDDAADAAPTRSPTNVFTSAHAPALWRDRNAADAYRQPMTANGSADDMTRALSSALGNPIINA
jgi:cobalamin biosynthesis protein CbiG|tara:strand:- start:111 stop:491 length:381 start_codon:yes stop_codon:yes gene_type:complete|eukprot:30996-Pelagococcus_subviridis.AAC.20